MNSKKESDMHLESKILLKAIEEYLDSLSATLVADLMQIVRGELNNRRAGLGFDLVAVLYFEYSYDDLQLYFWEEDVNEQVLSSAVKRIPSTQTQRLLSVELRDRIFDLEDLLYEDESLDEDTIEAEMDEFNRERCQLFEKWFLRCWALARAQVAWTKRGYFSIHDSYFKTKLD